MHLVRTTETRRTATPAAVMTTLASPALGGAHHPLWKVEAAPGTAGPLHHIDTEQIWTLLDGTATVTVHHETAELTAGDTVVIPAHAPRRLTPGTAGYTALVTGPAPMHAYMPDDADTPIPLPWTA